MHPATTSQTVGPFFHIGLEWLFNNVVAGPDVAGEHVVVQGMVQDGDGKPVSDAVLEIWQADARGAYVSPDGKPAEVGFKGYARIPTDDAGKFHFSTIKPGRVAAPGGGLQAPHLSVVVFMRGVLRHMYTRVYFPDEKSNDEDLVLQRVPKDRRTTLIAKRSSGDARVLEWNVVVQGDDETVFFDY